RTCSRRASAPAIRTTWCTRRWWRSPSCAIRRSACARSAATSRKSSRRRPREWTGSARDVGEARDRLRPAPAFDLEGPRPAPPEPDRRADRRAGRARHDREGLAPRAGGGLTDAGSAPAPTRGADPPPPAARAGLRVRQDRGPRHQGPGPSLGGARDAALLRGRPDAARAPHPEVRLPPAPAGRVRDREPHRAGRLRRGRHGGRGGARGPGAHRRLRRPGQAALRRRGAAEPDGAGPPRQRVGALEDRGGRREGGDRRVIGGVQNIGRVPELQRRILFTFGMLAVYRLGAHIVTPGIKPEVIRNFFEQMGGTMFGLFNLFSGGALEQLSIFALGIMPYISASIIFQLLTVVIPQVEQLQKEGEQGRRKITQWTRYATIVIALVQSLLLAFALENGQFGANAVIEPGWAFRLSMMLTLTTGTAFIMWLGEQITE